MCIFYLILKRINIKVRGLNGKTIYRFQVASFHTEQSQCGYFRPLLDHISPTSQTFRDLIPSFCLDSSMGEV